MKKYQEYYDACWNEVKKDSVRVKTKRKIKEETPRPTVKRTTVSKAFLLFLIVLLFFAVGTRADADPLAKELIEKFIESLG